MLLLVFTGEITSEDIQRLAADILELERRLPVIPHRLTDLRPASAMLVSFPDILALARIRKEQIFPNCFRSALLVDTPVQMGYARMFQNLNDHPQIALQVFTDEAEARAWLAAV